MCAGKIDLLLGLVWHDVSSVKHTSPGHPGCNNRDIFLFCCFRFAVWFASIFVYPFSCHVLLEIQAHGLLLHSFVFVGGLCAV